MRYRVDTPFPFQAGDQLAIVWACMHKPTVRTLLSCLFEVGEDAG
jgi:hypothetical protein